MLKENILSKSLTSKALDEDELILLRDTSVTDLADAADLPSPNLRNLNQAYFVKGVHYRCEEVSTGVFEWVTYDTSGQSLHYPDASGKPTLDGITLNGAMTKSDLGIALDTSEREEQTTNPSGMYLLLDNDKKIDYDTLENFIYENLGIANLPKYETYNNPLLTSNGTNVTWEITHTCKTSKVIIQLFLMSSGLLQTSSNFTGLTISNKNTGLVSIQWNSGVNIPANTYYVVLIG